MESSDEDDELALLLVLILRRRRQRRLRLRAARRTTWAKSWNQRRQEAQEQGATYANLVQELDAEDPEMFRKHHCLDDDSFQTVLAMVGPLIQKEETIMRSSISPDKRLAATLRFLATGG